MGNEGIKLLRVRRDVAERIERLAADDEALEASKQFWPRQRGTYTDHRG